jgi:hypothetical protein
MDFIFSHLYEERFLFMMVVMMLVMIVCSDVHIYAFPDKEQLMKKPTDYKVAAYTSVNMCSLLTSTLLYGKPFSPFYITICGFF